MADDLDLSLLPEDIRHLGPLIERYAESDDVERSTLLEAASDTELRELRDAPKAHWAAINAFLDEHVAAEPGRTRTSRSHWTASPRPPWRPSSSCRIATRAR